MGQCLRLPSNAAMWVRSLVGGAKIPHASWLKHQNIKHKKKNIVTNSMKTLENGPHQEKKNLKKL